MSLNRTSTVEAPRKPAGAFFHWEDPGEPVAVHFHLNTVEQLEAEFLRRGKMGAAGVLLGRIEHRRKLTVIIEDYESATDLEAGGNAGVSSGSHGSLEEMIDRWRARPEKRISIVGFYRSSANAQDSLNSDDLEIARADSLEPKRVFLLLEPQVKNAGRGTLYMVNDGAVSWRWHAVTFSRQELGETGVERQLPVTKPKESSLQLPEFKVPERQNFEIERERRYKNSIRLRWGIGIMAAIVILTAGFMSLRNTPAFHGLSNTLTFKSSGEGSALGLKLQHIGNDWQLSWDRNSPVLTGAAAGRLVIADGFIHKSLDLDMSELRNGSVTYTPTSDDVTLKLEVLSPEHETVASETSRIVAGLPPLPADPMQAIGGLPDSRVRPGRITFPGGGSSAGKSESANAKVSAEPPAADVPLAKSKTVLMMSPPKKTVRQVAANIEAPAGMIPSRAIEPLAVGSSPPPPVTFPKFNSVSTPTLPPVNDQVAARLLTRKDPVYPDLARQSHISGTVELQFRVNSVGKVENVIVLKGTPILAKAAIDAVQAWRYNPAQVGGAPVDSEIRTIVVFKLD